MCGSTFEDKTKTLGSQDYPGSQQPPEVQSNLCPQANQPWDLFHSIRLTWYNLPRQPVPLLDCPRGGKGFPHIKSEPRVSICVICFSKFIFWMNLLVATGRQLLCTLETFSSPCWTNLVRFSSWDFHPSVSVKSKEGTQTVRSSK